ncbi:MAG: hypothetical protein ACFFG0_06430 [Candidatus Thorarchaeota archaeon]
MEKVPENEEKIIERAVKLLNKGKLKRALSIFTGVVQKNPKSDAAWAYIGQLFFSQQILDESINATEKALELNQSNMRALNIKTQILTATGPYEEALKCCEKAYEIHTEYYWSHMAAINERFKFFKKGLECIEKAFEVKDFSKYFNSRLTIYKVRKGNDVDGYQYIKLQLGKKLLNDGLKYGDYYYQPVLYSSSLLSIPLNDDSEIVYTTCAKNRYLRQSSGAYFTPHAREYRALTNVIFTTKGLSFFNTAKGKHEYMPWSKRIILREPGVFWDGKNKLTFKLVRDIFQYETSDEFGKRILSFPEDIQKLIKRDLKIKGGSVI